MSKRNFESIRELVERIYPLHRTINSDDLVTALEIVRDSLPSEFNFQIETFEPGSSAWTWTIPPRYRVRDAYIELPNGERVARFQDNPLHLVSYSKPHAETLTFAELDPHLHYTHSRPDAIPWNYSYYSESWGFCISRNLYETLPREGKYRVVIDAEFDYSPDAGLPVGAGLLTPDNTQGTVAAGQPSLLLCAHICHPMQANDGASGVAVLVELAHRLTETPLDSPSMGIRLLVCPETIGSIAWFSRHSELPSQIAYGIFLEMLGSSGRLALQRSRQDDSRIDRIARHVMHQSRTDFYEGPFREVICNDELVINGPGVDIPCISLSRWPYPEYHTSDDNMAIISEESLRSSADIVERIVRIAATDYIPMRRFTGPVFLTGVGLWIDWREDPESNRLIEQVMLHMEGDLSVFDISQKLGVPYEDVRVIVERFREKGLLDPLPVPTRQSSPSRTNSS